MKKSKRLLCCIGLLVVSLMMSSQIRASETRTVETKGTIGFTGVYEPVGAPEPVPEVGRVPEEGKDGPQISIVTKQKTKQLPKTNMVKQPSLVILGGFFLVLALLGLMKRQKKSIK
jgi:LPXTG-motif cell wall-anchored protein